MKCDILIIGAGLSGLSAAMTAFQQGIDNVLIVDFRKDLGGFTFPYQDCDEFQGEKKLIQQARQLPFPIIKQTTVVGFFPDHDGKEHEVFLQSPQEHFSVLAKKVIIATGSLEKPRESHKIAGGRPAGIMTSYMAAEMIKLGYKLGEQCVVMEMGRSTRSAAKLIAESQQHVQVFSGEEYAVTYIEGIGKLKRIKLKHKEEEQYVDCDTFVFSKGRYGSTFFLKGVPIQRDHDLLIKVDSSGQTGIPGVFAAGSCTSLGDDNHLNSMELGEFVMKQAVSEL